MQNIIEQCILVCLDSSSNSLINNLPRFRHLFNYIQHFNNTDVCVDYVTNMKKEDILLIISFEHIEIIPLICQLPQIYSIYIFYGDESTQTNEDLLRYRKVQGLYRTIDQLFKQIKNDKKTLELNHLTINSLPIGNIGSFSRNDQTDQSNIQEATFMYSQILRDIFVQETYTDMDKNEMIDFFREQYHDNETELEKITRFQCDYTAERAIYWYTMDGFLYRMINKALRMQDIFTLYRKGEKADPDGS